MSARSRRLKKHQQGLKACTNYYDYLWFCYHSKFYGSLITHGRKATAFRFLSQVKSIWKSREFFDPSYLFLVAMLQITPKVLIVPKRLGASFQGVPFPLSFRKRVTFAVKWTTKMLKDKQGHVNTKSLVDLLHNSLYNRGEAFERKRLFHRQAVTNRFLIQRFFR